jgi:hypothetical protein
MAGARLQRLQLRGVAAAAPSAHDQAVVAVAHQFAVGRQVRQDGQQPWAMASSTDTATESLRGSDRYHVARSYQRPAWRRPAGRRGARAPGPWCRPGPAWRRAASRRWPPPGAPRAASRAWLSKTCSTRSGRRSAPGRGWQTPGRGPWPAVPAASPPGRRGTPSPRAAQLAHALRPSPASRWWHSAQAPQHRAWPSATARRAAGVTRMSLPQADPTSRPRTPPSSIARQPGQRAVRGEVVRVQPVGLHLAQPARQARQRAQQGHVAAAGVGPVCPAPAGVRGPARRRSRA